MDILDFLSTDDISGDNSEWDLNYSDVSIERSHIDFPHICAFPCAPDTCISRCKGKTSQGRLIDGEQHAIPILESKNPTSHSRHRKPSKNVIHASEASEPFESSGKKSTDSKVGGAKNYTKAAPLFPEDWEKHYLTINSLYHSHELSDIKEILKSKCGFEARLVKMSYAIHC